MVEMIGMKDFGVSRPLKAGRRMGPQLLLVALPKGQHGEETG
jgi:hypothetical protein